MKTRNLPINLPGVHLLNCTTQPSVQQARDINSSQAVFLNRLIVIPIKRSITAKNVLLSSCLSDIAKLLRTRHRHVPVQLQLSFHSRADQLPSRPLAVAAARECIITHSHPPTPGESGLTRASGARAILTATD